MGLVKDVDMAEAVRLPDVVDDIEAVLDST
jgi:hypothetical protein